MEVGIRITTVPLGLEVYHSNISGGFLENSLEDAYMEASAVISVIGFTGH